MRMRPCAMRGEGKTDILDSRDGRVGRRNQKGMSEFALTASRQGGVQQRPHSTTWSGTTNTERWSLEPGREEWGSS